MNRGLAVSIIKEILSHADCSNADYIALMPPDKSNNGFQIHLRTTCNQSVLLDLVKRNKLEIKTEDGLTIIYDTNASKQEIITNSCCLGKYYMQNQLGA